MIQVNTPQKPASSATGAGNGATVQAFLPAPELRHAVPSKYNIIVRLNRGKALAYNGMYGSFAVWSEEDLAAYDRFVATDNLALNTPGLKEFLELGYMTSSDNDEIGTLRKSYEDRRYRQSKMMFTIAPTLGCNFGCSYCFQGLDKPITRMTKDVQDAYIKFLEHDLPHVRQLSIVWYGGEPLMGKQIIYDLSDRMIALCKRLGVTYNPAFIVTNGYSLNGKTAQELTKRNVATAQITIDGPAYMHDKRRHLTTGKPTFDRIIKNMHEVLRTTKMRIGVRVNVAEVNKRESFELIDDLADRGFGLYKNFSMYFAPIEAITSECSGCKDESLGKIAWGETELELRRYAIERGLAAVQKPPTFMGICQAVLPRGLLLNPDGDLHKCWDTVMHKEQSVGTIFEPEKVVFNANYQKWLQWTPFDNPVCASCKILPNCAGFCAFKTVHADRTHGEAGALPCPSWKFNIAEHLFMRAEKLGLVRQADWREDQGTVAAGHTGVRHSLDSMGEAARKLRAIPVRLAATA